MSLVVDTIGKITLPTGETVYGVILAADSEAEVKALAHLWSERVTLALDEKDDDEEDDGPSADEIRHMKALYDGEKRAGLHMSKEEYEQQLRDAGRGHLIRGY